MICLPPLFAIVGRVRVVDDRAWVWAFEGLSTSQGQGAA